MPDAKLYGVGVDFYVWADEPEGASAEVRAFLRETIVKAVDGGAPIRGITGAATGGAWRADEEEEEMYGGVGGEDG